jgi:hypothetical protein
VYADIANARDIRRRGYNEYMVRGDKRMNNCRHRKTWLVAGGHIEWCYECGAMRQMERIDGVNAVKSKGRFIRPVGKGGENPYKQLAP